MITPTCISAMDISKFMNEAKKKRNYTENTIETENYVLIRRKEYEKIMERKPIVHAHAVINWLGDSKCSNCCAGIDTTEPYCQHCGASIDETEEREAY